MLAASTLAQASAAVMVHGPAFLIPALHARAGLSLAEAGLVAAAPTIGVMATLVLWGLVSDRRGERFVLLTGLGATTLAGAASTLTRSTPLLVVTLFLAGAAAASTNAASGRVVVGWFPAGRRGLAMGVRQMAQPVGVGVAADQHRGPGRHATASRRPCGCRRSPAASRPPSWPWWSSTRRVPTPAPGPAPNPYRRDRYLARIHGVSVLLVVPQFVVWTFALVWLVQDRGWSPAAAGSLVAVAQVGGALGRIAVGHLSDVVGGRMRPLRWVALAAAGTMAALGVAAGAGVGRSRSP